MRGFDSYWLAGGEFWASRGAAPVEIDLELAVGLHSMHLREVRIAALAGDRKAADFHHARETELRDAIAEKSLWRRAAGRDGDRPVERVA